MTAPIRPVPLRVLLDNIPKSLKAVVRWVVWSYVFRDTRWTKPPFVATDPRRRASATDPSTWSSFEDAVRAYESRECDGIGFMLGDGYVGFDADGTDASEHVRVLDTYTERSPSGKGVHAIALGTKPGPRARTGCFELYDRDRYFTVTGHHVEGAPLTVESRQAEIEALYAALFPDADSGTPAPGQTSGPLTDEEVLERATRSRSSGGKFKRLWKGDWSGYVSQSEADCALCSLLARASRCNPAQMDRLFRRSGLFREKWNRVGAELISRVIASAAEAFPLPIAQVELVRASDIPPEKLDWLWSSRLAIRTITLVEGGPERGKSTLLISLAARITQGHSLPGDTTARAPADVVMLVAEDDLAATVVPRLLAAGADLRRVHFLKATRDDRGDIVPFHLSDDCDRLQAQCQQVGNVALVIVDPLVSFMGSRRGRQVNTSNDMEVRKALGPLKRLAEELGVAVAAIRHYRKGAASDAMEAGGGSVAFAALVRVIIAALPDPRDPRRYLLAVAKNNLVQRSARPALAYEIVPWEGDPDIGRIAWGESVDMSANEVLAALAETDKINSGKVGEAKAFLETFLANGEWVATKEIIQAADAQGIKKSAVERAKSVLNLKVERRKEGWGWRLNSLEM